MAPENNTFRLSRRSRAGALLLLFLILALLVVWRLLPVLFPGKQGLNDRELQLSWERFRAEQVVQEEQAAGAYTPHAYRSKEAEPAAVRLMPFDPNTATEEELLQLGLPRHTVRTLIKYRSKGGRFRQKEELQKLYTLSRADYKRIAPYVRIADGGAPRFPGQRGADTEKPLPVVELNSADAAGLMALKGIGPGYSRRILNYRDALGGFYSVEQLREVYGFPDSTYLQLREQLTVDPAAIRKINVNTAGPEELARHPYIGRKMADNIIRLRNDLKSFDEIAQLRQVPLINEEKYRKIAPYLSAH